MPDPIDAALHTPITPDRPAAMANGRADALAPNPRLAYDPRLHQTVLEFYDPATRQLRYLPQSASVDFSAPTSVDLSA